MNAPLKVMMDYLRQENEIVQSADRLLSFLSKIMGIASSIAVLILLIVTTLDVLLLKIFSEPIPGASELIAVFMPFVVFGFLLETQRREQHITVDIFTGKIVNPTIKKGINIFVNLVCLGIVLIITWYIVPQALRSTSMREHVSGLIPYPVYFGKLFTASAFCLVSIQSVIVLIQSIIVKNET
jgi:TRAP-type C4-dicarboxylate transport system permease small subunit